MWYDVVLVVHIVAGFVGFGAMGATGFFATRARRGTLDSATRRFFRPGTNWAARSMYLVPLSGIALLAIGPRGITSRPWVLVPVMLWFVAAAAATSVLWPAEVELQREAAAPGTRDEAELAGLCRRCAWAAAVTDVIYVVALVIMVAKPGG